MAIPSPADWACIPAEPSLNTMSIRQRVVFSAVSRQMKVGEVISGGKIDPSRG
jgi:hypothetical protein